MSTTDETHSEPLRVPLSDQLARTELDAVPKRVLYQLSARVLREYACEVRAERNKYRSLYESHRAKAVRLEQELADAREACRRMAAALRANAELRGHHLAYDHDHHRANAWATRRAKAGTLELF